MPTVSTSSLAVQQSVALVDAVRALTRAAQREALTRDEVALVLARIQMTASALPGVLDSFSDNLLSPANGRRSEATHEAYLQYIDLASGHLERAGERLNKAGDCIQTLHRCPDGPYR